jgi:hypothetical protein
MKMWRGDEKGKRKDAGEEKRGEEERRDGKYEERIRTEKE